MGLKALLLAFTLTIMLFAGMADYAIIRECYEWIVGSQSPREAFSSGWLVGTLTGLVVVMFNLIAIGAFTVARGSAWELRPAERTATRIVKPLFGRSRASTHIADDVVRIEYEMCSKWGVSYAAIRIHLKNGNVIDVDEGKDLNLTRSLYADLVRSLVTPHP